MRLSLVTNWSLYHMEGGGGDVNMGNKTDFSNSGIKSMDESGDQKMCSPTIADSGYHSDSSTSRASSQSSADTETCQRKDSCEGEASGDEMAQSGSPKRRLVRTDPLVSPASDVEEDITNSSQRMVEQDEKDCDSSRSSSPEDNEESETGNAERLMNCPYCERSYKRLTSLREHVKRRHEVNNFSCPQCNYCFAFKSQLERHMSTHMPGRDQVCGVCNRAFADIYRLQRHMLIHASGNRRFPCGECGKAFKYKHHLKEHLRIHSGEKPYECPTCRKRFSHSGSYSSHISSKKCSPIKDLPSMVPKDSAAPVKIVNGEMSPSLLPGKSKFHMGLPQEKLSESYMTPLSITIPRPDAFDEKLGSDGTVPPTSPPNDAVKKVLQMVNATVSKQQQEKQHTDISKLKKTKHVPQDTPVVASPYEIKSFSSRKSSSNIPMVSPSSKSESNCETEGKEVVYVNGNGIHNVDKSYDIVGYTLQKVHEAQAMAKCLESHHPGRDHVSSRNALQELVYPLLRKGYPIPGVHTSSESPNEIITSLAHSKLSPPPFNSSAGSHLEFSLSRASETVQYNGEELTLPLTQSDGKPCCKYCRREFESPIDAHQHERYLCDLNADVLKMKLLKSNANQNLNKYFELQRELVASMEKTSELSPSSSSSPQVSPLSEGNASRNDFIKDSNDMKVANEEEIIKEQEPSRDEREETIEPQHSPADITKAQEQALRAFYAMQATPSIDGLSKIASALNLKLTVVEQWFEKTRECEENGSDPSLRGLGLVSNSPQEDATVEPPSAPSPRKDVNESSVVEERKVESPDEEDDDDEPPSPKAKPSSKPPPFSVAHLISPDTPMSKSKRESQRQRTQQHASPSSHNLSKCDQQRRHDSPLDLTKSREGDPLGRGGVHPKLIYGVNYPALYHPGYMLPLYAPDAYSMAQLSMENSMKAQTKAANTEESIPSRGFKRLSYVPVGCDLGTKRAKVGFGMDYPLAMPPLGSSLPGTDFYQALATASYLQAATSGGPSLPYYGFPFSHGSHLPPNGRPAQPPSNNAMETLINSHHELLDQSGNQSAESMDKNGKTGNGLYTCSMCPKTFQKHSSLLRHVYEHSGKRPHECEVCGKAFKHKHHLMEHQRLHSGEKPYQCNRCFKKFSHSGSYSQHMNHRYSYCRRGIVGPVCKGDKFKKSTDGAAANDKEKDDASRRSESQSIAPSEKVVPSPSSSRP